MKVGDWCLVQYDKSAYPGVIEDTLNGEVKVSVMVRCGPVRWKWPDPEDSLWYTREDVLRGIQSPTLVSSRGILNLMKTGVQSPKMNWLRRNYRVTVVKTCNLLAL